MVFGQPALSSPKYYEDNACSEATTKLYGYPYDPASRTTLRVSTAAFTKSPCLR